MNTDEDHIEVAEPDFAYSLNDEGYTDFENIMDEINSEYPAGEKVIVYKGEKIAYKHADFINIDVFFESLNETAYDECGEYGEDYMYRVDKEKRDELKKIISNWMDKNFSSPEFFTVKNIEEITVTSEAI